MICRLAISWIFDKSDIFGNGYIFEGEGYTRKSDLTFDKSDDFRTESELTNARRTANALRTAHSRPFYSASPPTDAPVKKLISRITSETC